jgi:hypothetical protein
MLTQGVMFLLCVGMSSTSVQSCCSDALSTQIIALYDLLGILVSYDEMNGSSISATLVGKKISVSTQNHSAIFAIAIADHTASPSGFLCHRIAILEEDFSKSNNECHCGSISCG